MITRPINCARRNKTSISAVIIQVCFIILKNLKLFINLPIWKIDEISTQNNTKRTLKPKENEEEIIEAFPKKLEKALNLVQEQFRQKNI